MQVKVKLPKYDGDERKCIAWINKAEEYLDIHNIHYEGEKIKYASMHLEGNAYNWYLWWKNTARICSHNWDSFRNDLIKIFQGVEEFFFSKLTRLQQKNSVDEYTCEWEALSTRVPKLTDDQRLQTYMHGLKQHICDELELHNISTLEEAQRKASIIEKKFKKSAHTHFNKDDSKRKPFQST